ncbi:MAG: hypothetical protein JOZ87_00935 [Chloroflexi bacterium]|nr:hypothetical protein [Chloroflexota bacterium]
MCRPDLAGGHQRKAVELRPGAADGKLCLDQLHQYIGLSADAATTVEIALLQAIRMLEYPAS